MINRHKYTLTISLLAALILFSGAPLFAAGPNTSVHPVNIVADKMDYDSLRDIYHAQGKVVITYTGGTLYADDVELDRRKNLATARGNALIKSGGDTLQGDKIIFNTKDNTGIAYNGFAFMAQNHFYIRGDKIVKKGEMSYFIENPVASTCDGDAKAWEIAGSEVDVTVEGYGVMKNARFRAKDIPVFYVPYLIFPAKTKRQSGLLMPYLAYSQGKDGFDIEIPFFWAISPQFDATFYQRYIEKRGFKEGVEFRYYLSKNTFGTFYGDFLENKTVIEDNDDTSAGWKNTQRRWSAYLNHETTFGSQINLRADIRKVSDKWYFHDFSSQNYYRNNYSLTAEDPFKKIPFLADESLPSLESTVRMTKGWSQYNITALISSIDDFASTNNDRTLQRYPEITFTGMKQSLFKTPVFYELNAVYDYFYRGEGQRGHFVEVNPTFSVPFNAGRYAKITPQISLREAYWSRDDELATGDNRSGTRSIYNASLSITSQVSRVFDVKVQNVEKIRHEIKPEIAYSYIPKVNQTNMPDYTPIVTPFITPINGLTTVLEEQNAAYWALTNTFTAKIKEKNGSYSYLEFLRLKLFQSYDINEAKKDMGGISVERRPFSDVGVEVDFIPYKYFSFAARNIYSVYNGWKQTNYDLSISDWRGDSVTVGYRYTLDSIEELNISAKAVITSNIDAVFISRRDKFNSRTVENTIGAVYHSQCWAVGLDVTRADSSTMTGASPQTGTDTRIVFKLSLTGLGKFGF